MNDYEQECAELARYPELSIRAQALWAYEHRKDKRAMRVAKDFFQQNPRHMARAVAMFPDMFEDGEERDLWVYLSSFKIASLNKFEAALLAEQWQSFSMSYSEVRERVESLKKPRERKPRSSNCKEKELYALLRKIRDGLDGADSMSTVSDNEIVDWINDALANGGEE